MSVIRRLILVLLIAFMLAPAAPARAANTNPAPMTGTWLYRSQTEEIVLVLNLDGSYSVKMTTAQGVDQEQGRWEFDGSHMTFRPLNDQPESYEAGMRDANTLVIALQDLQSGNPMVLYMQRVDGPQSQATPGGQSMPMVQPQTQPMTQPNQQAQPQVQQQTQPQAQPMVQPQVQPMQQQVQPDPQAICGEWLNKDEGEELFFQFNQDGRYFMLITTAQGMTGHNGTWTFDGKNLHLKPSDGPEENHPAALQGTDKLVLYSTTAQGQTFALTLDRQNQAQSAQQPAQQPAQQGAQQAQAGSPAAGGWGFELDGTTFVLILHDGGWFALQNMTNVEETGLQGHWSWDGQTLTLQEDGAQAPSTFGMVLAGDDRAELKTYNAQNQLVSVPMYRMEQQMENGQPTYVLPPELEHGEDAQQIHNVQQDQQQDAQNHQQNPALAVLPRTMVFRPYEDTTEQAFTVLVPEGWYVQGGIVRVDPGVTGGPSNSIEAKVDFSVHSDQQSTVAAWILPTYYYTTMGGTMVQQMYPEGSYYFGMEVLHLMDPVEFAVKKAFPYAHPNASQPRIVVQRDLPELAKLYRMSGGVQNLASYVYKAGMVELAYQENGVDYQERMLVVIQDRGLAVAGMWCNPLTLAARAPAGQLDAWEAVLSTISDSFVFTKPWMQKEIRSQLVNAGVAGDVQAEVERIDAEITAHRQKTNAAVNDQMYLNLTGQENYVDPDTGKVEQATNAWDHRLKAPDGSYTYTNDPEALQQLEANGYKETKVKQPEPITY